MWLRVSVDDDELLDRCLAVFDAAEVRIPWESTAERIAALRFEIANGSLELYLYQGSEFSVTASFRYKAKRNRYVVCFNAVGCPDPPHVAQLLVDQSRLLGERHGVNHCYILVPVELTSPLMRELSDLLVAHPAVRAEVCAEMADARLYRLSQAEKSCVAATPILGSAE